MKFEKIHSVYFLGIGGIGMSALAIWFKAMGKKVYGYDRISTAISKQMEEKGIEIHYHDDISFIPQTIKEDKVNSLIVFTPAVPRSLGEKLWFEENGFRLFKRAEILGLISSNFKSVAVAGTHGKTSVTSMIAHILKHANKNITAFVGGLMKNYNSNVIIGNPEGQDHLVLAEADEFDRSFLQLNPSFSIITSAEADHLDVYGKEEELKNSFRLFAQRLKPGGKIFIQQRFIQDFQGLDGLEIKDYGIESGDTHAEGLRIIDGQFLFNAILEGTKINDLELNVPGYHNLENALAAISVCKALNLTNEEIKSGLSSYTGVKRRFDIIINNDKIIYIDDYAHHPTEIEALLHSVKSIYPNKEITAIFQPHLYTRTRDFAEGFSKSLSMADRVILLPIYPAREIPIEGVESEMLLNDIQSLNKACLSKEDALDEVRKINDGILISIGAGDIDQLVPKIKSILNV
jgi:UDP-N-acetylmuramate--alanine ligase